MPLTIVIRLPLSLLILSSLKLMQHLLVLIYVIGQRRYENSIFKLNLLKGTNLMDKFLVVVDLSDIRLVLIRFLLLATCGLH